MYENNMFQQFRLLKHLIQYEENIYLPVDLTEIEKQIFVELPSILEKNAPPNFPELYFDFKQEYERFKEFILFEKLIGKNIVALGGGFSSGKSSFINSLLGQEILPSGICPSTSVPSYLVFGNTVAVYGINTFQYRVDMELEDVMLLSHGFGKDEYNNKEVTLGHLLSSLFISTPAQPFSHIALLDTPGYSKTDTDGYSAKTDERIAKVQLNSSNYILWFLQAEGGTITESDIAFIKTLKSEIPKIFIVNKADKVYPDELDEIIEKIKEILNLKKISYLDVLSYSSEEPDNYDKAKILKYLQNWNTDITENQFAYNFKILFTTCKDYYEGLLLESRKYLSRINKSLGYNEDKFITNFLNELKESATKKISNLNEMLNVVQEIQYSFFKKLKKISDIVHIDMPEPSEIDLLAQKLHNKV